ncbi:MAG: hypothetical protein KJ767_03690 [Nanoarchaeota archaeon]|nr:hypothetical protein [Nanoarchaeota archaeon]
MAEEKINFEEAKNKALEFIRRRGPSMPSQVAKEINIPPLFASALLSQLISEKLLKASSLKIGGSPLYYPEGEKSRLLDFMNHLPSIEKQTCEKLKREGILIDEKLELAEKVALRNTKDFSIPLSVKVGEEKKLLWKWFSLSQEEATRAVEKLLTVSQKPREDIGIIQDKIQEKKEIGLEKAIEIQKAEIQEIKESERPEITEEKVREKKPVIKERKVREKERRIKIDFIPELKKFLDENKVEILEENVIRKDREVELVLQLVSSLGKINFFAIAKNKKVINPGDLTLAYYKSQEKKLPLIFLTTGKFSKKTEERASELGITIKSMEDKL